jgi:hypothetical protein
MTAELREHELPLPQVGESVRVRSQSVRCSRCSSPPELPVFMGVTDDGARLLLWWCPSCKFAYGPTS